MDVLCDTREPDKYYLFLKKAFPDLSIHRATLRDGDYATNKVLVERKTIGDLYTSITGYKGHKGRFPQQVDRMATHTNDQIVVVMITGSVKDYADTMKAIGVTINQDIIYGEVASIHCRYKIPPLWIQDEWSAMIHMVKFMKKVDEGKIDVPTKRDPDILTARLLGISINQWADLKRRYHNLSGVGMADLKGLMMTRGIGESKALKIKQIMTGR